MAANGSSYRVLVTDFVWPNTQPERDVLSRIGAELIDDPTHPRKRWRPWLPRPTQ